jgi:hypothetical protein
MAYSSINEKISGFIEKLEKRPMLAERRRSVLAYLALFIFLRHAPFHDLYFGGGDTSMDMSAVFRRFDSRENGL